MFDLNEVGTSPVIFNGGNAGLAKNVLISEVERKTADKADGYPDYKIYIKDAAGADTNAGFYIPEQGSLSPEEFSVKAKREVGRVTHMVKSLLGEEYRFPAVANPKEAFDVLFNLIDQNKDKPVNVYVTYGTTTYPKKWLNLRYFEFMEAAANSPSRLRAKGIDLMERPVQDEPTSGAQGPTEVEDTWKI